VPDFQYIARDLQGQQVTGLIAAGSEKEVLAQLASRSLFPVKVSAGGGQKTGRRGRRIRGQLLATTYSQLSSLLRSGVPLLRSLNLLKEQTSHSGLANVLDDVHGRVEDGATLAEAMERHESVFRPVTISMVRAGSEGGFLEDALDRIARFTEEQEDLKSRTLGALAYPIFLAVFGVLVVSGLLVFFVPSFEEMFARLRDRGELPWVTDVLLWLSLAVQSYGLPMAVLLAVAVVALVRQAATERGRWVVDIVKIRLPMIGPIFTSLAIARLCRVLGTLLSNGVPILRSLEISEQAVGNVVIASVLSAARDNVSSGEKLAAPLTRSEHFPREIVEMISVAEEANTLETVLVDIADRLERSTSRRLDLFVRLLEPVLLLLLALVVMLVVMALLLPIMKMSSTL
jgi:general secretion pathway protein F/type IV pilus assembly protein PilC